MVHNSTGKEASSTPLPNKARRSADTPDSLKQKHASLLGFIGQKVQKTIDNQRDARRNQEATYATCAEQAGSLLTRGHFGCHYIEIYENAYIRIAASQDELKGSFATRVAPFEKFLAFSFSEEPRSKSNATESSASTLLRTATSFVGKGMKATLPGLAIQGVGHLLQRKLEKKATLTITTDHEVHVIVKTNSEDLEVGQALEKVAQTILGSAATTAPQPTMPQLPPAQPSRSSTAERIRELATLHDDGILDDAEFAAAKAKILGIP
jgi:hypothetical protein